MGTKGLITGRELSPAPPPAHSSPRWPRTLHAVPDPAHVAGNGTPQDLFSGPARPLGAPCSPEAKMPRPCSRGSGNRARGLGALRAHKEPFVERPGACGLARTRAGGARGPQSWCSGSGEGPGHRPATCLVGLGRARKAGGDSCLGSAPCRLLLGPHLLEMKAEPDRAWAEMT